MIKIIDTKGEAHSFITNALLIGTMLVGTSLMVAPALASEITLSPLERALLTAKKLSLTGAVEQTDLPLSEQGNTALTVSISTEEDSDVQIPVTKGKTPPELITNTENAVGREDVQSFFPLSMSPAQYRELVKRQLELENKLQSDDSLLHRQQYRSQALKVSRDLLMRFEQLPVAQSKPSTDNAGYVVVSAGTEDRSDSHARSEVSEIATKQIGVSFDIEMIKTDSDAATQLDIVSMPSMLERSKALLARIAESATDGQPDTGKGE